MQFTFTFDISAEEVFGKVTDPEFVIERCIALGSINANCESNENQLPQIVITRTESAELPAMMKKIVGQTQKVKTIEQWTETEESYDSSSRTTIAGTPITIDATQCLYNTEAGSEITVELQVVAKIPLLGKKIEPMIASKVRAEMLKEFKYTNTNSGNS